MSLQSCDLWGESDKQTQGSHNATGDKCSSRRQLSLSTSSLEACEHFSVDLYAIISSLAGVLVFKKN